MLLSDSCYTSESISHRGSYVWVSSSISLRTRMSLKLKLTALFRECSYSIYLSCWLLFLKEHNCCRDYALAGQEEVVSPVVQCTVQFVRVWVFVIFLCLWISAVPVVIDALCNGVLLSVTQLSAQPIMCVRTDGDTVGWMLLLVMNTTVDKDTHTVHTQCMCEGLCTTGTNTG